MADIVMEFPIKASGERVFQAVSTPQGLDAWWTKRSAGEPALGAAYDLDFGPGHVWKAQVTKCVAAREFELQIGQSHPDWGQTRVGFRLTDVNGATTTVRFHHAGWPSANDHWRVSVYCWAMYLRIMRRHIEHDEAVPFEQRLSI